MARATGMSQPTVSRIWRAFGLKPWANNTFKPLEDPLFIEKIRDVVGIYMNPPEHAVVCCVDEKTGIPGTRPDSAGVLADATGQVERRTHDYVRNGIKISSRRSMSPTGRGDRDHSPAPPRRGVQLSSPRSTKPLPDNLEVHIVLDNSSTHKNPSYKDLAVAPPRGSTSTSRPTRLVVVEPRSNVGSRSSRESSLQRSAPSETSVHLRHDCSMRSRQLANENPRPSSWRQAADEILESLAGYCQRISDSGSLVAGTARHEHQECYADSSRPQLDSTLQRLASSHSAARPSCRSSGV